MSDVEERVESGAPEGAGEAAGEAEWIAAGPAGDVGLVPFVASAGGRRMLCDVRGGIAWPWPKRIGRRVVARGAVCCVGFEPGRGAESRGMAMGHLLRYSLADTVDMGMDGDGWPAVPGVAELVRTYSLGMRCGRFTGWAQGDRQWPVLLQIKRLLDGFGRIPAIGDVEEPEPHEADAVVARWAGRLEIGAGALRQIAVEEAEEAMGMRPLTEALAAALSGYERAPWREPRERKWAALPRDAGGRG